MKPSIEIDGYWPTLVTTLSTRVLGLERAWDREVLVIKSLVGLGWVGLGWVVFTGIVWCWDLDGIWRK